MIAKHPQAGFGYFLSRTIAAQIHAVALIASILGTVLLAYKTYHHTTLNHVVAVSVYGGTAIFLFATSATYHFLFDGFQITPTLEELFERLDHIAIYLFISGTYTAFLMNSVSARWANLLLVVIWTIAALGILFTIFRNRLPEWARHRYVYTGLFLAMGFVFLIRIGEILHSLSFTASQYFIAGGLSYAIGAVVYAIKKPVLFKGVFGFHELWHLLVVAGFSFHYALIWSFY
jgi:hemolysin III